MEECVNVGWRNQRLVLVKSRQCPASGAHPEVGGGNYTSVEESRSGVRLFDFVSREPPVHSGGVVRGSGVEGSLLCTDLCRRGKA